MRRIFPLSRKYIKCSFFISISFLTLITGLYVYVVRNLNSNGIKNTPNSNKNSKNADPDVLSNEYEKRLRWPSWTAWEEPTCKVPYLVPEDPSLGEHIIHPPKFECQQIIPKVARIDSEGYLHIDKDALIRNMSAAFPNVTKNNIICAYRYIGGSVGSGYSTYEFLGPKWESVLQSPVHLTGDQFVVLRHIALRFETRETSTDTEQPDSTFKLPNLMLLGIDSISLNQFQRNMPLTNQLFRYTETLSNSTVVFLEKHMKVGDNSIPNITPLLTGLRLYNESPELPSDFFKNRGGGPVDVDTLPYLWNSFKDRGCVTLYDDDIVYKDHGAFHYPRLEMSGFSKPPTNHYFRPYWVYLRSNKLDQSHCYSNKPIFANHLQLLQEFSFKYASTSSICRFSYTFMPDLSHDVPHEAEFMDSDLKEFFINLHNAGILDNTIVVLFGDHGQRMGDIKTTYVGRFEARLPLMTFIIPKYWHDRFPKAVQTLKHAAHRITSHFDVYQTLNNIFSYKYSSEHTKMTIKAEHNNVQDILYNGTQRGQSLLIPTHLTRSCKDAGVPPQHCTCLEAIQNLIFSQNQTDEIQRILIQHIVSETHFEPRCKAPESIAILNLTTIQANSRVLNDDGKFFEEKHNKTIPQFGIVYLEVTALLKPGMITTKTIIQYNMKLARFEVGGPFRIFGEDKYNGCKDIQLQVPLCFC